MYKVNSIYLIFLFFFFSCSNQEVNTDSAVEVKSATYKVASIFPTSLPLLGENSRKFVENVKRASDGKLNLKLFEPGALVPGLESIPAVSKGSLEMTWAATGFFSGNDSAFSFFTAVPFGPDPGEYMAWMYYGDGMKLMNEMFSKYNIHAVPCGIQPPEASGWFRKEIKSVEDFDGLKMRFFGLGAKVMEKLGVATQLLAPGEIFQSLQLGTIDSAEFANPSVDIKNGFYQVAKYYYFPGWHQPASILALMINLDIWNNMVDSHKSIIELACGDMFRQILAQGEATQWSAMKKMRDDYGVILKRWPDEIISEFEKAWQEVVIEESEKNENFKKVYDSYSKFREEYSLWSELGYLK